MTLVKTSYNRRSFLKTSAAAGGGMILSFSWLAACNPTEEDVLEMPENWTDINAYLKIGENGVVSIMSPNPEIGQGVKTSMPMLIAEELDVDWRQVVVEQAGLDTENFTRQLAGGSQSIRQGWESLRMAGATARHMLMQAAAEQWSVPLAELTTEAGVVMHQASGQKAGYGELSAAAATQEVPAEVVLKDRKDYKIIGTAVKNVDGPKLVTGQPLFGLDIQREGMKIAMITQAPAFGMKLTSFDDSAVRNMPGIIDVFSINRYPEGMESTWSDVDGKNEMVAIVGNSTWEVMQAQKELKVEWETVSVPENSAEHWKGMERAITGYNGEAQRRDGNPEKAFREADRIIEQHYRSPIMAHNTMEPMNFFAHVRADKADLEGPVQTPENLRKTASQVLDMDESNISVMMTRQGGGFGRRLYGNFGIEAALISQKTGLPIKLIYTREHDINQGTYRPAYHVMYRAALDADNNLTALQVRGTGTNSRPVFVNRYPAGTIDNYVAENVGFDTNISTGAWRAPRSHFMANAEQSFLDELAEEMGKDPIDLRLELFDRAINDPVGENNDYDPKRYAGVLELVREKSRWGTDMPGISRGVSAYYCHNSYVAQVIDVSMINGAPKIQKVWCAVDCGIVVNTEGALNQIEGGIVDGIGHAMYSTLTFTDGRPDQLNFDKYRLIRNSEAPEEIETFFVDNGIDPTGLGEPSVPPIGAALANALYRATGERLRDQPFVSQKALLG